MEGIHFDEKLEFGFCECHIEGKSHHLPFQSSTVKRANYPLELVHSDVRGKIGAHAMLLLRNQMKGK